MDEEMLLQHICAGDTEALEVAIARYSAYVASVIRNRGRHSLSQQDLEELAADVFIALWRHGSSIHPGRLRPWLGSVARNRTVEYLRRQKVSLSLDEQTLWVEDGLWQRMDRLQRSELVRSALDQLDPQDQEIFYRHYDLCQNSREIAQAMGLNASTVRTRLSRGRNTLKHI